VATSVADGPDLTHVAQMSRNNWAWWRLFSFERGAPPAGSTKQSRPLGHKGGPLATRINALPQVCPARQSSNVHVMKHLCIPLPPLHTYASVELGPWPTRNGLWSKLLTAGGVRMQFMRGKTTRNAEAPHRAARREDKRWCSAGQVLKPGLEPRCASPHGQFESYWDYFHARCVGTPQTGAFRSGCGDSVSSDPSFSVCSRSATRWVINPSP
jgi:hypothetical protein